MVVHLTWAVWYVSKMAVSAAVAVAAAVFIFLLGRLEQA
jgi:hypothetical protein